MTEQTQLAWDIIETTNTNLFLTGKAGTGKTTFLRRLKEESSKRIVVVAPTGIAAINAEGVTIHSFFQLSFAPFIPNYNLKEQQFRFSKQKINVIRSIDTLVIDEISMVRADLLDAVDSVLRRFRKNNLPFGGVQMVMIGDLGQLAPVAKDDEWQMLSRYYATPYFFSSLALQRTRYAIVELTKVYRQSDKRFLDILNKVRENRADAAVLSALSYIFPESVKTKYLAVICNLYVYSLPSMAEVSAYEQFADPTAINNATVQNAVKGIYTVNGTKLNALQKGLNIVKFADGTVQKVLVK